MPNSLCLALGILTIFNVILFFLVDRYCDFVAKYGASVGVPKDVVNYRWFRLLLRVAHVVFCGLAFTLMFLWG